MQIDIKSEVARLQRELIRFRQEYLPALLAVPPEDYLPDNLNAGLRDRIITISGNRAGWQGATSRLAEALPLGQLPPDATPLDRADFQRFLFQPATPTYAFREGRIAWRVQLFMQLDLGEALRCWSPLYPGPEASSQETISRLSQVKQWILGLAVDDARLWNVLCGVLPAVADTDPAIARLVLHPDTWKARVRAGPVAAVTKELRFLDGFWFGHVLNNALLHVLGALANNHFEAIRNYLDHPHLRGAYTHLIPHYLFAVLWEKVAALRRLSAERPDLWD